MHFLALDNNLRSVEFRFFEDYVTKNSYCRFLRISCNRQKIDPVSMALNSGKWKKY